MTESEAIKELHGIRPRGSIIPQKRAEAIDMAIKAVEKQIPKKVKIQQWIDTKCECGYCFSKSYEDGYYSVPYENMTNYCTNCGQRLDWGTESEG